MTTETPTVCELVTVLPARGALPSSTENVLYLRFHKSHRGRPWEARQLGRRETRYFPDGDQIDITIRSSMIALWRKAQNESATFPGGARALAFFEPDYRTIPWFCSLLGPEHAFTQEFAPLAAFLKARMSLRHEPDEHLYDDK